jgi:hypothetical protein
METLGIDPALFQKTFVHASLEFPTLQIRLLELLPTASKSSLVERESFVAEGFAQPIHCTIRIEWIDRPPPYKALSYCWGKEGPNQSSHSVDIEGAALPITESLDSALRHLRHQTEPVIVWIDQICIDQREDHVNHERSDQVKMMARIYSSAEQVFVWLGPADQGSDEAMDFYAEVGDAIWMAGLQYYCNRDMMPLVDAAVHDRDPDDQLWQQVSAIQSLARKLLPPRLQALADWDRRPYFGRVWVMQEFCVGANPLFICGNKRIPVDYVKATRLFLGLAQTHEFLNAVRNLGDDKIPLLQTINQQDPTPAFFSARTWWQKYNCNQSPGDTLFDLLCKTYVSRQACATKPQDRVLGLVSMASDANRFDVYINYNTTVERLLTGVAKTMIEQGNLAVLAYVQFPRNVDNLPSWVPDWHSNLRPSFYPYPRVGLEYEHYFNPSGNCHPAVVPDLDNSILGLRGFIVDTIEDVGSTWTDDINHANPLRHQSYLAQVRFLCRLSAMKNQSIYSSRQRRDEAEWRVPIADIWEANKPEPSAPQRATDRAMRAFAEFRNQLAWFESAGLGRWAVAPDDREPSFYRLSMAKTSGMRPFITNSGYVGMGPSAMCPGDVVVILFGARVCSVLRPRDMWAYMTKQYLYIGEAYCDGVMDGELLSQRRGEIFYLS